jgi:single-strand DNA-binding protein
MANYNKAIIAGNLVRDVEVKFLPSGAAVGNFTIAVNEKYKDKVDVHYFDCVAFAKTAEVAAQYLTKGSPVLIDGRLRQRRWEHEGVKKSKVELVVGQLVFLGKTKKAEGAAAAEEEDIPF